MIWFSHTCASNAAKPAKDFVSLHKVHRQIEGQTSSCLETDIIKTFILKLETKTHAWRSRPRYLSPLLQSRRWHRIAILSTTWLKLCSTSHWATFVSQARHLFISRIQVLQKIWWQLGHDDNGPKADPQRHKQGFLVGSLESKSFEPRMFISDILLVKSQQILSQECSNSQR